MNEKILDSQLLYENILSDYHRFRETICSFSTISPCNGLRSTPDTPVSNKEKMNGPSIYLNSSFWILVLIIDPNVKLGTVALLKVNDLGPGLHSLRDYFFFQIGKHIKTSLSLFNYFVFTYNKRSKLSYNFS